jgi:hypothetical protein
MENPPLRLVRHFVFGGQQKPAIAAVAGASGVYLYLITDSQGKKVRGKVGIIK